MNVRSVPAGSDLPKNRWVYVGSRTEPPLHGEGLSIYSMDVDSGKWELSEIVRIANPSFLAFDWTRKYLYTVQGQPHNTVLAFRIDKNTGGLTQIDEQPTEGNPVHLAPDSTNRFMMVANAFGGSLSVFPLCPDGTLKPACDLVKQRVVVEANQSKKIKSHPHQCAQYAASKFVLVPDRNQEKLFVYQLDLAQGKLLPNDPPYAATPAGCGPRHIDFHPDRPWAYVVSEQGSTVTVYELDMKDGALKMIQSLSTLPADFVGENTGAEICVSPNGKFVYASNRGHNSLAIFAIDQSSGALTIKGWVPSQGDKPRFFALDPSASFLYAANEGGDSVVTFKIDQESGNITPTGQIIKTGTPVSIVFT